MLLISVKLEFEEVAFGLIFLKPDPARELKLKPEKI
jgi:hypothetical protein